MNSVCQFIYFNFKIKLFILTVIIKRCEKVLKSFSLCLQYFMSIFSLLKVCFMSKRNSGQMINCVAYQHTKISAGLQAYSVPVVPLSSSYPSPYRKVSKSLASLPPTSLPYITQPVSHGPFSLCPLSYGCLGSWTFLLAFSTLCPFSSSLLSSLSPVYWPCLAYNILSCPDLLQMLLGVLFLIATIKYFLILPWSGHVLTLYIWC